jgi:acylphosphatase
MPTTAPNIAKKFLVKGRVQGVGFRFFTEHCASDLRICGYVRNLWDGSVEVYAIGDASALEQLKIQLAEGPRSARVTSVDESDEAVDARCRSFTIEDTR